MRMQTVEPVVGQIKVARGVRRFRLGGLENASAEWKLICDTRNQPRLRRRRRNQTRPNARETPPPTHFRASSGPDAISNPHEATAAARTRPHDRKAHTLSRRCIPSARVSARVAGCPGVAVRWRGGGSASRALDSGCAWGGGEISRRRRAERARVGRGRSACVGNTWGGRGVYCL